MGKKKEIPECTLCNEKATHFVTIPDASRTYKYGSCFRCKFHMERAEQYFKRLVAVPVEEYLEGRKGRRL